MVKPAQSKNKKKSQTPIFSMRILGGLRQGLFYSLPYILTLTAAGLLFGTVIAYALNSSAFHLQEVRLLNVGTMTAEQAFDFCELKKGENLISLDLVSVQQVIKRKHPEYKEVMVRRVLPNRIEVFLKRRTPVAQVAFASRYIQIDKDRVLLPGASTEPFRNLTIIQGAPMPRGGLFVGVTLKDEATPKAMKLAELIKSQNILRKHVLSRVDITDPQNFTVFVDRTIEIRLGSGHFMERLKILDQTLKTIDLDPEKIRYIDLRFDDVVIGPL